MKIEKEDEWVFFILPILVLVPLVAWSFEIKFSYVAMLAGLFCFYYGIWFGRYFKNHKE